MEVSICTNKDKKNCLYHFVDTCCATKPCPFLRVINHNQVLEMYEALKGLNPCMRPVPGGETPYEWVISEKAMAEARRILSEIEGEK